MTEVVIKTPTRRPEAIGKSIRLRKADDVNAAMEELRHLRARRATVDSTLEERHRAVEADREKLEKITIEGDETTLPDRMKALDEAIMGWLPEHLEALLPDKGKTLALDHGELKTRDVPESIKPIEGLDEKAVLGKIEEAAKPRGWIAGKLQEALTAAVTRGAKFVFGDLLTIKIEPNKTGRLKAWQDGKLTDKHLENFGLVAVTGEKTFMYKLKD